MFNKIEKRKVLFIYNKFKSYEKYFYAFNIFYCHSLERV